MCFIPNMKGNLMNIVAVLPLANFSTSLLFEVSVFTSTVCGQTPRPVVGNEIQTCCNFKASSNSHSFVLVDRCFKWIVGLFDKV